MGWRDLQLDLKRREAGGSGPKIVQSRKKNNCGQLRLALVYRIVQIMWNFRGCNHTKFQLDQTDQTSHQQAARATG